MTFEMKLIPVNKSLPDKDLMVLVAGDNRIYVVACKYNRFDLQSSAFFGSNYLQLRPL